MKTLLAILLCLLGLSFLFSCSPHPQDSTHKHEQEKALWTCPMHAQIQKDGPGTCPICGMSLVKSKKNESGTFELTEYRRQLIGVKTLEVQKKNLFHTISAPGKIAFDPELYSAQNEYLIALNQQEELLKSPLAEIRKSAVSMVESAALRLKVLGLSDVQIKNIRSKKESGAALLLPQKGAKLLIYAEVFEMDLSRIKAEQKVRISGENLEGKILEGKVLSVDRIINPTTRTAKVRIEVPKMEELLRSESYVDVEIITPLGTELAVPMDAVVDTGKEAWVFVSKGEGRLEARKIQIKFHADSELAIASGLSEGENIVSSANFLVDSESKLRTLLEKAP